MLRKWTSWIIVTTFCVTSSGCLRAPEPNYMDGPDDAGSDAVVQDDGGEDVRVDANGSGDAGTDAADLGPCGGPCESLTPVCNADTGQCVECLAESDCEPGRCDTTTNECVECLDNTDCPSPTASSCDTATNTCVACSSSPDCGHLTDTTVCDTAEEICVECTGTEYDACDGVCDSRANTCTSLAEATAGPCDECVSDAECRDGMVCVPQMFAKADGTGDAEVGTFCLWERDASVANAPDGACSNVEPYIQQTPVTSIDGVTTTVCDLRATTCPGYLSFDDACTAPGADDECGADGFEDAFCVMFDQASNRCTPRCVGNDDCSLDCDMTPNPDRCALTTG